MKHIITEAHVLWWNGHCFRVLWQAILDDIPTLSGRRWTVFFFFFILFFFSILIWLSVPYKRPDSHSPLERVISSAYRQICIKKIIRCGLSHVQSKVGEVQHNKCSNSQNYASRKLQRTAKHKLGGMCVVFSQKVFQVLLRNKWFYFSPLYLYRSFVEKLKNILIKSRSWGLPNMNTLDWSSLYSTMCNIKIKIPKKERKKPPLIFIENTRIWMSNKKIRFRTQMFKQ